MIFLGIIVLLLVIAALFVAANQYQAGRQSVVFGQTYGWPNTIIIDDSDDFLEDIIEAEIIADVVEDIIIDEDDGYGF